MKVSELEGEALNAWVAKAEGWKHLGPLTEEQLAARERFCLEGKNDWWQSPDGHLVCGPCCCAPERYDERWEISGPIIEREHITIMQYVDGRIEATKDFTGSSGRWLREGSTPLIAAMRCYVASKFGDEVTS